jgi:DNA modification methylase
MRLEHWHISRFVPYSRHLRKNDHALDRMVALINEFGFKIPVLARSDGETVDGDLRLKAAHKLGIEEIPVILCDEWSPAQVKCFRLAVNQSTTWADWNWDLVSLEIEELKGLDVNLELTGFDPIALDDLLFRDKDDSRAEATPEIPIHPVTQLGDVWACDAQRVGCGNATSRDDVAHVLGGVKPLIMVTDPPWGVQYDPAWRERAGLGRQRQIGLVANDHRADWSAAYQLFEGDIAYVWHAGVHASEVARGLVAAGLLIRAQIIWAKQHFALSRGEYHYKHEPCWYAVREGKSSHWCGDRTQSTLWEVANLNPFGGDREEVATGHGTQKPIEIMRRPILNHTLKGAVVYDPFLGSGTTLIAAELCERSCYGLEIDPRYVDVVVLRWQQLTGKHAVLESSGETFEQTQAVRRLTPEVH